MKPLATIREFKTKNFIVRVDALPEDDTDTSFDETGETAAKIESGEYVAFMARAVVLHRPTGIRLGADYLGGCIYKTYEDFADHIACGEQNRKLEAEGATGRCGSYFADMISEAIAEARGALGSFCELRVRS